MPLRTHNDDGGMFEGGDRLEMQRMLAETHRMLENTRSFLKCLHDGDDAAHHYIEALKENLENDLRRLESKHLESDGPPAEPAPEK